MNVSFELTGRTPLLMHQDSVEHSEQTKEWQRDPANKNMSVAGDDRTPAWTWQGYLYSDGKHVAMPAANIMVCLRQAGAQVILKKQKTFKELTQSGMLILTEFCQFHCGGQPLPLAPIIAAKSEAFTQQSDLARELGFRLWAKRAVIGRNKHVRVRPRFDSWKVSGELIVTAPELTQSVIEKLFEIAGGVGLGDWRPGCKTPGPFGMFEAKLKFQG